MALHKILLGDKKLASKWLPFALGQLKFLKNVREHLGGKRKSLSRILKPEKGVTVRVVSSIVEDIIRIEALPEGIFLVVSYTYDKHVNGIDHKTWVATKELDSTLLQDAVTAAIPYEVNLQVDLNTEVTTGLRMSSGAAQRALAYKRGKNLYVAPLPSLDAVSNLTMNRPEVLFDSTTDDTTGYRSLKQLNTHVAVYAYPGVYDRVDDGFTQHLLALRNSDFEYRFVVMHPNPGSTHYYNVAVRDKDDGVNSFYLSSIDINDFDVTQLTRYEFSVNSSNMRIIGNKTSTQAGFVDVDVTPTESGVYTFTKTLQTLSRSIGSYSIGDAYKNYYSPLVNEIDGETGYAVFNVHWDISNPPTTPSAYDDKLYFYTSTDGTTFTELFQYDPAAFATRSGSTLYQGLCARFIKTTDGYVAVVGGDTEYPPRIIKYKNGVISSLFEGVAGELILPWDIKQNFMVVEHAEEWYLVDMDQELVMDIGTDFKYLDKDGNEKTISNLQDVEVRLGY